MGKRFSRFIVAVLVFAFIFGSFGFRGFVAQTHAQAVSDLIPFSEGEWPNEFWGFMDAEGNIVVPAIYDYIGEFENGFASVMIRDVNYGMWGRDLWGLFDSRGRLVVPIEFTSSELRQIRGFMNMPSRVIPSNVEQLHWRYMRPLVPTRTPFRITDVGTGIYYYVIAMSNGNHSDVETATAADTALLNETFGGWQTWSGRPVWVTIGNRTFSASIHNMPHAQQTIADNNMDGHICLHFYGSTTHNTNLPTYHHVIMEAQAAFELLNQVSHLISGASPAATPSPTPRPAATPTPRPAATPTPRPTTVTANPTRAAVIIDGVNVDFIAYNISGNNFIRIRDLAMALDGSAAQFNLHWDSSAQAIFIITGVPYEPVGGELTGTATRPMTATATRAAIYLDGVLVTPRAYTIAGTNFFMLAELADLLEFSAVWDRSARAIRINTEF